MMTPGQVEKLLDDLEDGLSKTFRLEHLERLAFAEYDDLKKLRGAALADLEEAGIPTARARLIVNASRSGLKRGRENREDIAEKRKEKGKVEVYNWHLVSFWENLPSAKLEGAFLYLTGGTFFLGQPAYQDKLFVRQEYKDLSSLLDTLHATETGVAVIGTPGIGKSMFGYWLMHKWALEGRSIVFQKENFREQQHILFCRDGVFEIVDRDLLDELLGDSQTRYLVDGVAPQQLPTQAKTILLTPPDENIYHEFLKPSGYVRRYMDIWTVVEIELVRQTMYPKVTLEECQCRLKRWGTLPRYVLEKGDHVEQACLERAIASCSLHKLKAAEGLDFTHKEDVHCVVQLKVLPDSQHGKVEAIFASDFVAQSIFDRLWKTERADIIAWVSAGAYSAPLGALWRSFYGQACRRT